ncbi:hypothetical protein GCM10010524_61570 [Streptomyces mexicanus]
MRGPPRSPSCRARRRPPDFEVLQTPEPGQVLVSYLPAPGTGADEALALVGSWGIGEN